MVKIIFNKLKYKFAKWIWKDNDWTKAVDDVEKAISELRGGEVKEIILNWQFKYLRIPNKYTISIKLTPLQEEKGLKCGKKFGL